MPIQPPPVNMLANPYIPNVGNIMQQAQETKNLQSRNAIMQQELADYPANKEAAAKEATFKKDFQITKAGLDYVKDISNPAKKKEAFTKFTTQLGISKPVDVEFEGNKTTFKTNGYEFKATPEAWEKFTNYFVGDKSGKWNSSIVAAAMKENPDIEIVSYEDPASKEGKDQYSEPFFHEPTGTWKQKNLATGKLTNAGKDGQTINISPESKFKDERALAKEFTAHPVVKTYLEIRPQLGRAKAAIDKARTDVGSMNAADQTLITVLNKVLDPSSVVRESEYARTPQGMSLINRLEGKWENLKSGGAGLNIEEREAIFEMVSKLYNVSEKLYKDEVKYYRGIAEDYGFDPDRITRKNSNAVKTVQELSDDEIKKYTFDNVHFNRAGNEYFYNRLVEKMGS